MRGKQPLRDSPERYFDDSYTRRFRSDILQCIPAPDDRFHVRLAHTFFYPESGGQRSDTGTIAGVPVCDVQESEHGVLHTVEREPAAGTADCELNWERRFDHMQQHTGQHVLSRAFVNAADADTVSFHMGDAYCTIDLDGVVSVEQMHEAERAANHVVCANRPVIVKYVDPGELDEPLLRKNPPADVDRIRLIEVQEFDVIGCCGTHVRATGELGLIKITRHEKSKGKSRVYFKVGNRALRDYHDGQQILLQLANSLTTSVSSLPDKIKKLQTENSAYRSQVANLEKRTAAADADQLAVGAESLAGVALVVRECAGVSEDYVRLLSSHLKTHANLVSVVAHEDGLVLCNGSDGLAIDFGPVIELAKSRGGKGGGKGGFANLKLSAQDSVSAFVQDAREKIVELIQRGGVA